MPTLEFCRCCGGPVSSEAATCPHCGQPSPFSPLSRLETGEVYKCRVVSVETYGAFLEIMPGGNRGLIHISEIPNKGRKEVADLLTIGDIINARCLSLDEKGRPRMSMLDVSG